MTAFGCRTYYASGFLVSIVRERAAIAISWRKAPPLSEVIALLASDNLDARVGACLALEQLEVKQLPQFRPSRMLQHEDLWLRIRAAISAGRDRKAGSPTLPELLDQIARVPAPDDPRGMWSSGLLHLLSSETCCRDWKRSKALIRTNFSRRSREDSRIRMAALAATSARSIIA